MLGQLFLLGDVGGDQPGRIELDVGDLGDQHRGLIVRWLAGGRQHVQDVLAVLVEVHGVGSGVDFDAGRRRIARQPAPALEIGADLADADLDRDIQRRPGLGTDLADRIQLMVGLEADDRLGQGRIVHAVRRRLSRGRVLHRQPVTQVLHLGAAVARAQPSVRQHLRPATVRGDGAIGGQSLDQGLIAGGRRRQRGQPVRDATGALGGAQIEAGVVAGGTDAPFLGELIGGQAEAVLGAGVFQDRGPQLLLTLGLGRPVRGGRQTGDGVDVAERAGREALAGRLDQDLQHCLGLAGREGRALRRQGRRLGLWRRLRLCGRWRGR